MGFGIFHGDPERYQLLYYLLLGAALFCWIIFKIEDR